MDWTIRTPLHWDWETFPIFHGKESEISVATEESEWKVEGSIVNGNDYVHPSGSGAGACSGSEWGNGSSKGSASASIDSLSRTGVVISDFNFDSAERFPGSLSNEKDTCEVNTGNSPFLVVSDGPKESLIGLKLGKRTYFEDGCVGNNDKNLFSSSNSDKNSSSSVSMTKSSTTVKKSKVPHQTMQSALCQVEGCNLDLTTAKDYHRKHRVCEKHSKFPKVIVAGQERRFCQQCSRFHSLSEFDQKKRSCRRRLSDHNARRRKPQPETISFSSSIFPMLYYDDINQINLVFGQDPLDHVTSMDSSTCYDTGGFKLTQAKGSWIKSSSTGCVNGGLHFPGTILPNNLSTTHHGLDMHFSLNGTNPEFLDQGTEASTVASALNRAPDLRHAHSLLSTYSWDPPNPVPTSGIHFINTNNITSADPAIQMVDAAAASWTEEQNIAKPLPVDVENSNSYFQEIQLFKTPCSSAFYDSIRMD